MIHKSHFAIIQGGSQTLLGLSEFPRIGSDDEDKFIQNHCLGLVQFSGKEQKPLKLA